METSNANISENIEKLNISFANCLIKKQLNKSGGAGLVLFSFFVLLDEQGLEHQTSCSANWIFLINVSCRFPPCDSLVINSDE